MKIYFLSPVKAMKEIMHQIESAMNNAKTSEGKERRETGKQKFLRIN